MAALLVVGLTALAAAGCGDSGEGGGGGAPQPAPGLDGGLPDAGAPDAGAPDAGAPDAGAPDAGAPDAGPAKVETGATFERHPFSQDVLEVGTDAAGRTHVLVRYTGTPDFQGRTLPNDGTGSLQHAVVLLDAQLQATAVHALPSGGSRESGDEGPRGPEYHLAVLPDGSEALGGTFRDPLVTPVGTLTGRPFPDSNGFVALLSPEGTWRFARALTAERSLAVRDVAASATSIALAGSFSGASSELGLDAPPAGVEAQGLLLRVDLEGATRTVHAFTGSVRGFGSGVALGPADDSFVAGHTVVTASDGSPMVTPYLARVNANGGVVWEKRFGEFSGQLDRIAVGPDGTVASVGRFNTEREVRWGRSLLATAAARTVLLVAAYDGPAQWGQELGRSMLGANVAVDARGLVTVAGRASGVQDLGGGALGTAGAPSLFVARLSGTGAHQWSIALPIEEVNPPFPVDVAVRADGQGRVAEGDALFSFTPTRP
ncbi:hypothetical protein FGE12_25280 [Aggregicoccus sp. 17bor-14]|uniref:hypothetical protein n=1 Tax=Myxococcaceae TaxID=31 RepID=UPI00129CC9B2|nr:MULTISPECIES: hypothetical protein [Myxococcaceae]MBF5045745.1 hypothetical protein [Simulacricoccus sp. 17bor-14]MRI91481.1 hypothetical protein [Aggregicoccus sp. 17bor-14]